MKIKTNIRAGSGGTTSGGTGGGGSSTGGKSTDVVPVIVGGINPASRCYGL